jgi:uncharacterized protein (DUF433 family)
MRVPLYWVSMPGKSSVIHSDPEILGGTPVFVGTRVPVQSLFDYLEAGDSLDEFLRQFPSVRRDQAIEALEIARRTLPRRRLPQRVRGERAYSGSDG